MRRFGALLNGLPLQSLTWAPERLAAKQQPPPVPQPRVVSPLAALQMFKGG